MSEPVTAIHVMEDRIGLETGASPEAARHCALRVWDDLTTHGYNIVAGPPEGFRLVLEKR